MCPCCDYVITWSQGGFKDTTETQAGRNRIGIPLITTELHNEHEERDSKYVTETFIEKADRHSRNYIVT